jgi:hypothetical protein
MGVGYNQTHTSPTRGTGANAPSSSRGRRPWLLLHCALPQENSIDEVGHNRDHSSHSPSHRLAPVLGTHAPDVGLLWMMSHKSRSSRSSLRPSSSGGVRLLAESPRRLCWLSNSWPRASSSWSSVKWTTVVVSIITWRCFTSALTYSLSFARWGVSWSISILEAKVFYAGVW